MTTLAEEALKSVVDLIPLKDVYMQFLLWINDDFDDDLLMDAMECLLGEL